MTQLILGEQEKIEEQKDKIEEQKIQLEKKKAEEEEWLKEREAKQKEHDDNYEDGSTSVILHEKKYYFIGDVSHCGREEIKHNARKIREIMIEKKVKYGHKNCNDLPTFTTPPTRELSHFGTGNKANAWDTFKSDQIQYGHDLYVFEGEEIKIAELIGEREQTQIYCLDDDEVNQLEDDLEDL